MSPIRNLLALVGLVSIVLFVYAIVHFEPHYQEVKPLVHAYKGLPDEQKTRIHSLVGKLNQVVEEKSFDEGALDAYMNMAETLLDTGVSAEATVWKVKVEEDLSAEEVEETMRFVANEHNIKNVGELPLYKEVESMSGQPFRFMKLYMFCNAMTAAKMLEYSDAFSAYLQGRFGDALDDLELALDRSPTHIGALSGKALTLFGMGRIDAGQVIGWFPGRMEFGPRALGSRSILGDARSTKMQATMNLKIKFRESFRPFAPVVLEDLRGYAPLTLTLESCLASAKQNRQEFLVGNLQVNIAEREVDLDRRSLFPSVALEGTYFRQETGFVVGAGDPVGFIDDPDGWDISAVATWDFWQWGRTSHSIKEKLSRLAQARYQREEVSDAIELEVKEAYLQTQDSESNILAVEKAVEQARENFRITEQRFAEQMATTTDVLDAQTLLSRTLTNYYNALYDFKISKAALYRAMGMEEMP